LSADVYCGGVCETIFGQALKLVPGMRDRVLIATKCGIRFPGDPDTGHYYRYDSSPRHIISSCERSLQRLGVETIDLYQLHRPDFLMEPASVAEAFDNLKSQGKVREFGVSNFSPSTFQALQRACPMPLVVNQVEIQNPGSKAAQPAAASSFLLHCTIVQSTIQDMKMTFRHMPVFVSEWRRLGLPDEDLQALERQIMERPEFGVVMNGTGGVRKVRFAPPSWRTGKSGATRVCYVVFADAVCYLFLVFPKNERANLSAKDKATLKLTMDALRRLHAGAASRRSGNGET